METSNLYRKVEMQSESSDSSYNGENSVSVKKNESFNPLSIENLLNHHEEVDLQSYNSPLPVQMIPPKKMNVKKSQHPNISLEQFIEYLNLKFNGDKTKKITKDTLNIFYKQIQICCNLGSLTRSEKRSKIKVFMKLYKVANSIIYFLEYKPRIFLDPILLHIKFKINNRKKYQVKVDQNNQH